MHYLVCVGVTCAHDSQNINLTAFVLQFRFAVVLCGAHAEAFIATSSLLLFDNYFGRIIPERCNGR